jgi:hypothetical protein
MKKFIPVILFIAIITCLYIMLWKLISFEYSVIVGMVTLITLNILNHLDKDKI